MADITMEDPKIAKAKADGEIISQTLDNLNDYSGKSKKKNKSSLQSDISSMYEFNKDVLSAVYSDKGIAVSQKG